MIKITNKGVSRCIVCLLETEQRIANNDLEGLSTADVLWYRTWMEETAEIARTLKSYVPKTVLDVGSGIGRDIYLVLETIPKTEITGVEKDPEKIRVLMQRFGTNPRVTLENADIFDFLNSKQKSQYDIALCPMATFGNINDPELFKRIIETSGAFAFSLYNRAFDEQRDEVYRARGHKNFVYDFKQHQYCFNDWVSGLVSRSYTESEIGLLVESSGARITDLKQVGMIWYCVAEKK